MKNKKFYFYLAAMILGFVFVSCSGDDGMDGDKVPPIDAAQLVGTWKWPSQPGNSFEFEYIQFRKDGSLIIVYKYTGKEEFNIKIGTYRLASDNIGINFIIDDQTETGYCFLNKKLRTDVDWIKVDDSVINSYVTVHDKKEYIKQYEVNLDKYKVDLEKFKFDLDQYKVDIDGYEVSFPDVNVNFCPDDKHPHAIDMGAAGKWACCNVEASDPGDWGGYYAWGETEQEERIGYYYQENRYKFFDGSYKNIGDDIAGTSFDVAHVQWGGKWKMPSAERFQALIDNTTFEDISLFGDANIDNCYYINGKFYRIEDVKGLKYINGNVYKINDIGNCYLLDGVDAYKIENIQDYYILNGEVYKFDKADGYYVIDGKTYNVSNMDNLYVNGNTIYVIPKNPDVKGAEKLSESASVQSPEVLECASFSDISTNVLNMGISNVWIGTKFTSTNGNSIYFPTAGYLWNGMEWDFYGGIYYWSSSQCPDISQAYRLKYVGGWTGMNVLGYRRGAGLPVRPVM